MQEWKPLLKIMMQTNEQYINKSALNECITYLKSTNVKSRNIHR